MKRNGLKLRKLLAVMIVLCLAVGILSVQDVSVMAAGEEFEYRVLNDGMIEITKYRGTDTEVSIPGEIDGYKVREIGDSAFYGSSNLISITIPEGVWRIGNYAFKQCNNLNRIIIPEGVKSIGNSAFSGCSKLSSIIIPESVMSISDYAFSECSSLRRITIPEGVTRIGNSVFSGCSSLSSITIPGGVTSIDNSAFSGCSSLSSITIPESVTSIGFNAFGGCSSLKSIIIPEGVISIGGDAGYVFQGCSSLSSITIPKGVMSIRRCTFQGCSSLISIIIPESVERIDNSAFYECSSLVSILVDDANEKYTSQEGVLYNKDKTILIAYPEGKTDVMNVNLPESVTGIGDGAFYGCSKLSSVAIPEGVTSIGESAFWGCSSLKSITIPESVTSVGYNIKNDSSAFANCNGLTKITNNSMVIIPLRNILNSDSHWCDLATGERITELGKGTAIAKQKPVVINKTSVKLGDGAGFTDKNGNRIDYANVVIGRTQVTQPEQDIVNAADEVIKNAEDKANVLYYDISAYINTIGGEPAVLNGSITISLPYPSGVTKDYDIIVLHNTSRLGNVKKYDGYFTFETDGLSPFTVIALEAGTPSDNTAVRGFVNRLYTLVLAREAEEAGLESWTNALVTGESSGVDAGYGFVFSDECKQKNLSNEDFVEILYNTFMNRASDEGGKTAWVSQLDAGVEREKVFEGFIYSAEFSGICADYGINVGSISDVGALVAALSHYRNQNADITIFVARCYTEAMGRAYEPDGLEAWCKVIIEKSNTPKQVAQNFIFSEEFTLKNLSAEEYVQVLYRTFMGREADEGGLAAWVEVLKSGREDRAKVLEGFSDSVEFDRILQSFGLN